MGKDRSVSPEKELLRLIEGKDSYSGQVQKNQFLRTGRRFFAFGSWKARFLFFKDNLFKRKKFSLTYEFNLLWLNRLLELTVVFLLFYLISNSLNSLNNLKKIPALAYVSANAVSGAMDFEEKTLLKKSSSYYLEKVGQRDIFNMEIKKSVSQEKRQILSDELQEAIKSLRLVGISWSENPDAMIEDTRAMRTFFVKRGQTLGDFKVKAIFKDKVILLYKNNEEIELK